MSTARGSASRTRKQAHQNSFAFRHNKHSTLTEKIKAAPNEGLCPKCHEKVEWRKKYRKYKPLTQPKKCTKCELKKVRHAYHTICEDCAISLKCCAKCLIPSGSVKSGVIKEFESQRENVEEQVSQALAMMNERQKRAFLRQLDKSDKDDKQDSDEDDDASGSEDKADAAADQEEDSGSDLSDDDDSDSEEDPVAKQLKAGLARARQLKQMAKASPSKPAVTPAKPVVLAAERDEDSDDAEIAANVDSMLASGSDEDDDESDN